MVELFGLVVLFGLFVISYNLVSLWKQPAPLNLPVVAAPGGNAGSGPREEGASSRNDKARGEETRTFFIHLDGKKYPLEFSKTILKSHGEEIAEILKVLLEALKVVENGSNLNQLVTKAWLAEKSIDRLADLSLITPKDGASLVQAMDRFVDRRIEGQFAPLSEKTNVAALQEEMDDSLLRSDEPLFSPDEEAQYERVGASRRFVDADNNKSALQKALFVFENYVYNDAPGKEQKLGVFRQQLGDASAA